MEYAAWYQTIAFRSRDRSNYSSMSEKMSKKRGPNSPNESEKMKTRPSAAAATLSMASMLSVVSGAFSSQGASSVVSDTNSEEEENTTLSGSGSNTIQDRNVWSEANLTRSQVRSPKKPNAPLEPLFTCFQDGARRDEIAVEILSKKQEKVYWNNHTN